MSITWDFGDGATETGGPDTWHRYTDAGTYTVTATSGSEAPTTSVTVPHGPALGPPVLPQPPVRTFAIFGADASSNITEGSGLADHLFMVAVTTGGVAGIIQSPTASWPLGGTTDRIDFYMDGVRVQDWPQATVDMPTILPANVAEFQSFLGLQATLPTLTPGAHQMSVLGLTSQGSHDWIVSLPYTVT